MKTLKITFLLALFLTVSSQTYKIPSGNETTSQEAAIEKNNKTELDLYAHMVRGIRVPTQG